MKHFFKTIVPISLSIIAFSACNKETNVIVPEAVNITVKAIPQAFANPETRTYIDDTKTIIWGTDEYMTIGVIAGETSAFATSAEDYADVWDGEAEAYFGFSLTPGATADSYTYVGLYPASAAVDYDAATPYNNNKNAAAFKVSLPSTQNASATSYDPAAYIMVAKPEPFDAIQTEWTASYRRATALNKVTLTNIPEDIVSVEFTAPNEVYMAGRRYIDLTTGESGDLYGDTRSETIEVKTSLSGDNKVVWFTSWETEIPVGGTFKIVAKSATKSYTRTLNVANKSITFKEGYLNTLKVNMATADVENLENFEGNYIIGARPESKWFLMTSTNSNNYYTKVDTDVTTAPESVNYDSFDSADDYIWTVSKVDGGYAFKSVKTGKYLDLSSDGNAAHVSDAPVAFSLAIASNHQATIKSNTYTDRVLQYNSSSPRFAFYKGTQKSIYMIPAPIDERTEVTLSFAKSSIETDTDDLSFTGQSLIVSPNVPAVSDNISWSIEDPNAITDSFSNGVLSLNGEVGTATVTASFAGDETYKNAIAQYTITVVDANVNDGTLAHPYTASEARALALNGDKGSYYITGIVTKIQNQYSASYGTANFWIDEEGTSQSVFEAYKIKYFGNVDWVEGNAEIAVKDEVIIYGTLTLYTNTNNNTTTPETSSGYLVSLNGKTKGLTPGTLTATPDNDNKQITVTWGAATGSESTISYVVSCGTQTYNANAAGSHTFTMTDYDRYTVSVDVSASDAISGRATTTVTLSDPSGTTPTLQYTLDGTDSTQGSNGYATESEITQNDIDWIAVANTTINPWRFGGKNLSDVDRAVYSTTAIASNISSIEVESGSATATVNSLTISVHNSASDAASGDNPLATKTVSSGITGSTVTLTKADNTSWAGKYYRIVYNVTAGSSNQYVQFKSAKFYGTN